MLWLALRLPRLAVEHSPRRAPAVAVENGRIVATDQAAEMRELDEGNTSDQREHHDEQVEAALAEYPTYPFARRVSP